MSEPWGPTSRVCAYCNETFMYTGNQPEWHDYVFCSDECFETFKEYIEPELKGQHEA